jgi:hypothetical protein
MPQMGSIAMVVMMLGKGLDYGMIQMHNKPFHQFVVIR